MYKQLTPEQVEIWLQDPVTKAYLEGIEYCRAEIEKQAYSGTLIDPRNNDLTCHNLSYAAGRRTTLIQVGSPYLFLGSYEQPEVVNA